MASFKDFPFIAEMNVEANRIRHRWRRAIACKNINAALKAECDAKRLYEKIETGKLLTNGFFDAIRLVIAIQRAASLQKISIQNTSRQQAFKPILRGYQLDQWTDKFLVTEET